MHLGPNDSPEPTPVPGVARPSALHRLAQRHIDDEVLAAGLFKPNAAGSFELAGIRALRDRQTLKGRGAYLGERVIMAVTALHLYALLPFAGLYFPGGSRRFDRSRLLTATPTSPSSEPWTAIRVVERFRGEVAELRVFHPDDGARAVIRLLVGATDPLTAP